MLNHAGICTLLTAAKKKIIVLNNALRSMWPLFTANIQKSRLAKLEQELRPWDECHVLKWKQRVAMMLGKGWVNVPFISLDGS